LLADGDGIGNAIDKQAESGPEGHQKISQALARFADQVRDIVDKTYHGSLVYAGGDDVLALLPLHTALKCAEELHAVFQSILSDFKDKEGRSPTLSVGIAVVHHISLLQDALEVARAAERKRIQVAQELVKKIEAAGSKKRMPKEEKRYQVLKKFLAEKAEL
jgi:CRISPR-associated protein Cmr2